MKTVTLTKTVAGLLVLVMMAPVGMPVAGAAGGDGTPWSSSPNTSNLPPGCSNDRTTVNDPVFGAIPKFTDDCFHMRGELNNLDSPVIDVLLLVPASPWAERDLRAMQQVIHMYEAGFEFLAWEEGMDWLAKGVEFHVTMDIWNPVHGGGEFTTYPITDPEIVVITSNPVVSGVQGIGIAPFNTQGMCHGLGNPFDIEEWENLPGFDSHHDGRSGTYTESCEGSGGNICFAVNNAIDPVPGAVENVLGMNTYDLVAHEVGHCLRLGHVGDASDHASEAVAYPDIMSYTGQAYRKCVSTLDLEQFAVAMSPYLDVNGDGIIDEADRLYNNDHIGDGDAFQVQLPEDHYYASSTGEPMDCPQPDVGLVPLNEPVDFYPEGGPNPEGPAVDITTPGEGADVVAGQVSVAGSVDREGSPGLTAQVDAPSRAEPGQTVTVIGSAVGGKSSQGYTCSWTNTAGADFADPDACTTTVSFSDEGSYGIQLTVNDQHHTHQTMHVLSIKPAGLPDTDPAITGGIFAYNVPGGLGVSNVGATATEQAGDPVPKYVGGTDVSIAARSVEGTGAANGADCQTHSSTIFLYREDGTLVDSWEGSAGGDTLTGFSGCRYDDQEGETVDTPSLPEVGSASVQVTGITLPVEEGRYYLGVEVDQGDSVAHVTDNTVNHFTGLKPIDVVGAPAVERPASSPQETSGWTLPRSSADLDRNAASDAEGDGMTPFSDLTGVEANVDGTTLTITIDAVAVPKPAGDSPVVYHVDINGCELESYLFIAPAMYTDGTLCPAGLGDPGTTRWDDYNSQVVIQVDTTDLADAGINSPYNIFAESYFGEGFLGGFQSDDRVPDTGTITATEGPTPPPAPEPTDDGAAPGTFGELGELSVSDDGANLLVELDLAGVLDGQLPQIMASPFETTVDMTMAHNRPTGQSYQLSYSLEALGTEETAVPQVGTVPTPTGEALVQEFGLVVYTDVGSDGLRTLCPIQTDLSGSSFDSETSRVTWTIPYSAFMHTNYPSRDDGCGAFDTSGDPLGPGDVVKGIFASMAPKAVLVSGFPPVDQSHAPDYTISGDVNNPPTASAQATPTDVDEGGAVTLDGTGSMDDGELTYSWAEAAGSECGGAITNDDQATATWTAPAGTGGATCTFELTVTDDGDPALQDTDTVAVTVNDGSQQAERVDLYLDDEADPRASEPVSTGGSDPGTADWATTMDLAGEDGEHTITAQWVDSDGSVLAIDSVTVTIQGSGNQAPVLDPVGDKTVDEGSELAFQVTASDGDQDPLSFSLDTIITDHSFTDNGDGTADFSWTPGSEDAGTHQATFEVFDGNGGSDSETITITVQDTTQTSPAINITDPQDGATISDPENGLSVTGDYDPEAPVGAEQMQLAVPIGWDDPGQGGSGDYAFVADPASGATVSGPTTLTGEAGNSDTDPNDDGGCQSECEGGPYEFGPPQASDLRPGDWSSVCTLNFVYEYLDDQGDSDPSNDEYRYFFGSAAHCAATGSSTNTNGCNPANVPHAIGSSEQLGGVGTETITATLAYSSWATMQELDETDADTCAGNDFALFEIKRSDLDKVHPAVRMYGGPTGLGDIADMSTGDEIRGYGRSDLHDDTLVNDPEQSLTNPKDGVFLDANNGGWSYYVYLLPQGVPGDSGGGIMDIGGKALGAASTIGAFGFDLTNPNDPHVTLPGSNNYANIAWALEYMEDNAGWAPELVTWDDFDADPRPDAYGVPADSPTAERVVPLAPWMQAVARPFQQTLGREAAAPSADVDVPIVGGIVGEPGVPRFSNDADALTIRLPMNGQLDGEVPSSSGTPISYEVSFTSDHNGVELSYRASYEYSSYGWRDVYNEGTVDPERALTDDFGFFVETAEDPDTSLIGICPVDTDLSQSTVDQDTGEVVWVIPLDAFTQSNKPVGNTACPSFQNAGRGLQGGDTLASIEAVAIITTANVNHGNAYGALPGTTTDDYTLSDTVKKVTFTVNGMAAGEAAPDANGDWTHTIDFDAFDADGNDQYTVAATFGTATETVVYSAEGTVGPCADPAGQIVVTIEGHTACTAYDPASAGTWNVEFEDLSDLQDGQHTVTATAYDGSGDPLDSDSITVTVDTTTENTAPTAVASANATSVDEGEAITVDGTDSTDAEDGTPASHAWADHCGGSFADAAAATTTWTAPSVDEQTVCTITLTVTDSGGLQDTDSVQVTVDDVPVNEPPAADAGTDQTVDEGDTVTLDGSGSSDDQGIATWDWTQESGPAVTLSGADSAQATFTAPEVEEAGATLVFELNVTDAHGAWSTDTVQVDVLNVSCDGNACGGVENLVPVITGLGTDASEYSNDSAITVDVDGTARDGNGADDITDVTAEWFAPGDEVGTAVEVTGPTVVDDVNVSFSFSIDLGQDAEPGSYSIEVTVTDSKGETDTASVAFDVVEDLLTFGFTEGTDHWDFSGMTPGQSYTSANNLTVTRSGDATNVYFTMGDFTDGSGNTVPVLNNAVLHVHDGSTAWDPMPYDGAEMLLLGEIQDGETWEIQLVLDEVPAVAGGDGYSTTVAISPEGGA